MSLKPTWATQGISEQLELHSELRPYLKNKTTKPEIVLVHCFLKKKKKKQRKKRKEKPAQIFVRLFQNDRVQKLKNSKINCVSYKRQNQVCLESRL